MPFVLTLPCLGTRWVGKHRSYTQTFEAVPPVTEDGSSITQTAEDLDVSQSVPSRW